MPQQALPASSGDKKGSYAEFLRGFRRAAKLAEWNPERIVEAVAYSKSLRRQNLPTIFDHLHFCLLTGMSEEYVLKASNAPQKFYRRFVIPKRGGGTRRICEPLPSLKAAQHWILENVLDPLPVSVFAKAYRPDRSIRDNARLHRGQEIVVRLDIADFFPSIRQSRVSRLFRDIGYTPAVAALMAGLCTLGGRLPQGAPTSPAISNLICRELDRRLGGFARERLWRYTRYADDLVFSGDLELAPLFGIVNTVVRDYGFRLRDEKTRVMRQHQRQVVTGVVVNSKLQVPREYRREVRQQAYYIRKFGLVSHMERTAITQTNYLPHLIGRCTHLLAINPKDRIRESLSELKALRNLD